MERLSEPTTENFIHCPVHGWVRYSRHHIKPTSRGGGSNKDNINKETCDWCHPLSHRLNANMAPDEIIDHYVKRLWNGQIRWVFIYLWKHLLEKSRKMLGLPSQNGKWGMLTQQVLRTSRLQRALEDELRTRRVVRGLGLKTLERELRIRRAIRKLGLEHGAIYLVNERTGEVSLSIQMNGRKTHRELLKELLDGRELGPEESIRQVVRRAPIAPTN